MQFKLPAVAALFAAITPAVSAACTTEFVVSTLKELDTITGSTLNIVHGFPGVLSETTHSYSASLEEEVKHVDVLVKCDLTAVLPEPQQNLVCGIVERVLDNQYDSQYGFYSHASAIRETPFADSCVSSEHSYQESINRFYPAINAIVPVCAPNLVQRQHALTGVFTEVTKAFVVV